jgi:hypothetical protein
MARRGARMPQERRSKFNARKTVVDGIVFHSAKEARRYGELKLLEKTGEIRGLILQPSFPLDTFGVECRPIGIYRADFEYEECVDLGPTDLIGEYHVESGPRPYSRAATLPGRNISWARVVEDVKGFKTPLYRWKKKHFEAQHGIQIREIR